MDNETDLAVEYILQERSAKRAKVSYAKQLDRGAKAIEMARKLYRTLDQHQPGVYVMFHRFFELLYCLEVLR